MPRKRAQTDIDGIPVYCTFTKLLPIDEVKCHPQNPNKHPPKQIRMLGEILRGNGWRIPCTVSARSGLLTRGEGRFLAAQELGLSAIPVDIQPYIDEAAEVADLIADNTADDLSTLDDDILKDLVSTLDSQGCNLAITGLDSEKISQLIEPIDYAALTDAPTFERREPKEKKQITITYTTPEEYQELLDFLGIDGAKRVYSAKTLLKQFNR